LSSCFCNSIFQSSFSTTGRCTSLYRAVVAASRFVLQYMWVRRSANNQYISVLARISMHHWSVGDKKRCTFQLWEGFFARSSQKTRWGKAQIISVAGDQVIFLSN
jgi:hypothetical protein